MILPALTGGSFIVVGVLVVLVVAIGYGYYTYKGSGITPHPRGSRGTAPGAGEPSKAGSPGRVPEDPEHPEEPGRISTHGTK